jgi:hypothetical protein
MTKKDAARLLELIQLAFPEYGKGTDDAWKLATINMWQMSFPDVPYPIMEQAFNRFRMHSKFAPKVAEIVEELKQIYLHATECALIHRTLGNDDEVRRYKAIMDCTLRYKNNEHLGLQLGSLQMLEIGGGHDVQRLGASGDYEMP